MFRWLRRLRTGGREHELELARLKHELDEERAAIVVVKCAVEPACREREAKMLVAIHDLAEQNELLRSKLGDGLDE